MMPKRIDLGEWRFHQAVTGLIAIEAIAFGAPLAAAVAAALSALAIAGPTVSPTAWLWRVFARPAPEGLPAGPFRIALGVSVLLTGGGAALVAAGLAAGWALVGAAAALAAVGTFTGWCAVCAGLARLRGAA